MVVNQDHEVLPVKHGGRNEWSLPGGRKVAGEDPARRAVLEVAEETSLHIAQSKHMARYAGTVAAHETYLSEASGVPCPIHREVQDATWWGRNRPLRVQQHESATIATLGDSIDELGATDTGT